MYATLLNTLTEIEKERKDKSLCLMWTFKGSCLLTICRSVYVCYHGRSWFPDESPLGTSVLPSGPKTNQHTLLNENRILMQIVKQQCWISRSSEGHGHDATCWWNDLDLSNNVCEYEVNRLTNESY